MPIYPYSFQLPPLNVQDIPNDGAPGEFLGINVGGALDWLPAGGGGSGDMLAANNLSELTNFATARTNIGLGTASTPTFANLTLTSPSLASSAPVTISQTWNAVGQTFTALKVNAAGTSDANSASGSLLADFQVNAASKVSVTKTGAVRFGDGGFEPGIARVALGTVAVSLLGFSQNHVSLGYYGGASNNPGVTVSSLGHFAWSSSSTNSEATRDTILLRDGAANTLALRNGAAAQTFRVYKSYLNAGVDYERLSFSHDGVQFGIGTERAGSGIAQPLRFFGGSSAALDFANGVSFRNASGGTTFMTVASSGNVGIGTTAPGAKLEIVESTSNVAGLVLRTTTVGSPRFEFIDGAATPNKWSFGCGAASAIDGKFFIYDARQLVHRFAIDTAGNVGIGTTSPTSKLHVVGDAVLTGQLLGSNYTVGIADSVTQANIAITNNHVGFADSAIVITPKGTGAFILGPKPDGTTVGGAVRGLYAIDLQLIKTATTHVASGNYSVICGGGLNIGSGVYSAIGGGSENRATQNYSTVAGGNNCQATGLNSTIGGGLAITASGSYSFVGGGQSNTCSASYSFIAGGSAALANRYGLSAHAAGQFAAQGDAQSSRAVFRNKTTTNSAVELFLDGTSARYTVTSGKIISMLINITGTKSDGSAVAHYVRQYSIKNIGGTTSQVYAAVTVGTDNAAGTSIAISADDTNDSLKIEVTGVAAETWRWVASVDAVEVGHGV